MRLVMVGSGYVGLVSGACFSDFGHVVTCVDTDRERIEALRQGRIPIFEPGLQALVANNVRRGRLSFTTDLPAAMERADAVFLAVGTPSRHGDGHADLSFVHAAAEAVARAATGPLVLVVKSTVPVGTGDEVERIVRAARPEIAIEVASNPEFLREGAALEDFKRPDRVVVGVESDRARDVLAAIYRPLSLNRLTILNVDRRTSELIKYAANAFLATKITFINEIADLCDQAGADVQAVARGMGLDNRIGGKFLHAGPGYGGSCFPKDTLALARTGQDHGAPQRIVETVIAVNEARKRAMGERVVAALGGTVEGRTIALLGLTFKPNTDDMREAPSLTIIETLLAAGARVCGYDPEGLAAARAVVPALHAATDAYACVTDADAAVIVTEWDEFRALDLSRIKSLMRGRHFIDLRNVYRPDEVEAVGLTYLSIGRPGRQRS